MKWTASLGLTCLTATEATAAPTRSTRNADTKAPNQQQQWQVLEVSGYPFDVRYRSGYQSDAKKVRDWAVYAHGVVQDLYSFTIQDPFTIDVYPASEYDRPHGNMAYLENTPAIVLVTPSEYAGGYDDTEQFFRHGITHEYVHAVQKDNLSFHTHARWYMEGLAEAVAVYHTTDEIYTTYHVNHPRSVETKQDIQRGFGHVLGVNEYVYRGSMHFLQFMMTKYGSEAVFGITEQDAQNMVEAVEKALGITPLDLELDWLKYAQVKYGGDYIDSINRLGGTVPAMLNVSSPPHDSQSITVQKARYVDDDYQIVVEDASGATAGASSTFPAGEWAEDVTVSFDHELKNPEPITIRLHHAGDPGPGAPVEIYGEEVSQDGFYASSRVAISFAEPMIDGDRSLKLHAFASSDLQAEEGIFGNVVSNGTRIGHFGLKTGGRLIGEEITLDTDQSEVPLSEGQTVTIAIVDDATDDRLAERTRTVLGESSEQEEYTATPIEATATATAAVTATATEPPTPTESSAESTTAAESHTPTPSKQTQPPTTTETSSQATGDTETPTTVSTPGFGIGAALGSIGGSIAVARWVLDHDRED